MFRFCLVAFILLCMSVFVEIASTQNGNVGGATIKGEVLEATPEQNPIPDVDVIVANSATGQEYTIHTNIDGTYKITGLPAGRYTISISKDGYVDRVGKSKIVAWGGEIFDRMKMRKKKTLVDFFMVNPLPWIFILCVAICMLVAFILLFLKMRV